MTSFINHDLARHQHLLIFLSFVMWQPFGQNILLVLAVSYLATTLTLWLWYERWKMSIVTNLVYEGQWWLMRYYNGDVLLPEILPNMERHWRKLSDYKVGQFLKIGCRCRHPISMRALNCSNWDHLYFKVMFVLNWISGCSNDFSKNAPLVLV